MDKGGRPTKLTTALKDRICVAVRAGNYIETSAAHAGISKDTLYRWLKQGARSKSGPYREFSDAVEKALADAEVRDVAIIGKAAEEQWQAAAWRLERKFPDRWGRRERVNVDLEGNVTISGHLAAVFQRIDKIYEDEKKRSDVN